MGSHDRASLGGSNGDGAAADPRLLRAAQAHPHPLVFATVSGAHLYGFPSPDSDFDLRGAHLLPLREVVGLSAREETVASTRMLEGAEIDLVTHDLKKFIGLMLRRNGYVLEQLLSPLVVLSSPRHQELVALAPGCLTRHHAHHYFGFARTQWKLFEKGSPPRVKPLLYLYRVLLTGIHLMRSGEVCASLPELNAEYRLPQIPELIARKTAGPEKGALEAADVEFHRAECGRLTLRLEQEHRASRLPEEPSARAALDDLLVRARLESMDSR